MDGKLLFSDLELFNWEELSLKYRFSCSTQEAFLEVFLDENGVFKVDEFKGGYVFVYFLMGKYYVFRDVVGVKPVCFFFDEDDGLFKFGSSLNELPFGACELNPREYLVFDGKQGKLEIGLREKFYDVSEVVLEGYCDVRMSVCRLFEESVRRRVERIMENSRKIGILFSGGTDSTLMAIVLKKMGVEFVCYTASIVSGNITEGDDVFYAREVARECGFEWRLCELEQAGVEEKVKLIMDVIGSRDYTKVSVALPFFVALEEAKKDGVSDVFIGIGSEEIFADYKRSEDVDDINEVCVEGLKSLWERDLYRDNMLARFNGVNLMFPFLDDDFVNFSIRIDDKFKIDKENGVNKVILRDILRDLGLSERMVLRKKKAAQYGSRSDRVFEKICRQKKVKKQEYLDGL